MNEKTSLSNLPIEEKADIETIMRQSGCLNTTTVYDVYIANEKDVLKSICELMDLPKTSTAPTTAPRSEEQERFNSMREILREKYELYAKLMKATPHQ